MTVTTPIPTGTVTLLFTDIEGSTHLWETEPEAMAAALRTHDMILRQQIASAGGYVFKTVGDAFCAAFETPQSAVAAAADSQRRLAGEQWPTTKAIRVRMALHTGVCEERDNDYFGRVVNRTARLEAVAHGGQVLLSGATADLLDDVSPGSVKLRNLGLHRLKDLGDAEQVFQLEAEELDSTFPPLRSLDNPELSNNLPSLLSEFVGRQTELAEIRSLLADCRLVTLTGAGGSGKTRLALHAAAEMLDGSGSGVWFVELAAVTDGEQVPAAVATVLGVGEQPDKTIAESLVQALADQHLLILLDNCEHLVAACAAFVDRVSRNCPEVRLLVTSREPLGVQGERVYRVPSLSLPAADAESVEDLTSSDAVRLFIERARSQDAGFDLDESVAALVSSICRRLDGIPLALELAAARLSSMSLLHLNERLDQRFRLLTGGSRNALPRQQTLQAMVDWSFGLLSPQEKALLRRVSVFAGGFELEAAEAVGAVEGIDSFDVADLLGSLVDKSLVIAERSAGALRYRLLETIADYASQDMLRSDGELALLTARDRHAAFYLSLSESLMPALVGRGQGAALKSLDSEWDNLRAAFVHLEAAGETEAILRLCIALYRFFVSRGRAEALPYIKRALESSAGLPDQLVLGALICLAQSEGVITGPTDADARRDVTDLSARAFELSKTVDDAALKSEALLLMAGAAYFESDDELARLRAAEALDLALRTNNESLIGLVTMNLANFMRYTSPDESRRMHLEALERFKRVGDSMMASIEEHHLAGLCLQDDHAVEAKWHLEESLRLSTEVGAGHFVVVAQSDLCAALLACGEIEAATSLVRQCLVTARRLALLSQLCGVLFSAACCATWNGDLVRSARLHGAADAALEEAFAGRVFGWTASEDRVREEARAKIRQELPAPVFETEYARGALMSIPQAVDLALGRSGLD